jgi:hypothetical protein
MASGSIDVTRIPQQGPVAIGHHHLRLGQDLNLRNRVDVALPALREALRVTVIDVQWVTLAYVVSLGT